MGMGKAVAAAVAATTHQEAIPIVGVLGDSPLRWLSKDAWKGLFGSPPLPPITEYTEGGGTDLVTGGGGEGGAIKRRG